MACHLLCLTVSNRLQTRVQITHASLQVLVPNDGVSNRLQTRVVRATSDARECSMWEPRCGREVVCHLLASADGGLEPDRCVCRVARLTFSARLWLLRLKPFANESAWDLMVGRLAARKIKRLKPFANQSGLAAERAQSGSHRCATQRLKPPARLKRRLGACRLKRVWFATHLGGDDQRNGANAAEDLEQRGGCGTVDVNSAGPNLMKVEKTGLQSAPRPDSLPRTWRARPPL